MRLNLPDDVFKKVRDAFHHHHACWHYLRLYGSEDDRCECFPKVGTPPVCLRAQYNPGCGEDFLKFHRSMIRNFKWLIADVTPPYYTYQPWNDFPGWLKSILAKLPVPHYLETLNKQLEELVNQPRLDKLGQYIEGEHNDFPYIHFTVHVKVHDYEEQHFGSQAGWDILNPAETFLNEHFWGLHGWIDEQYARWQRANGQSVDQRPEPMPPMDMCSQCMQEHSSFNPWFDQWTEYLKSQAA